MQTIHQQRVYFITEQDGEVERKFKTAIINMIMRLNKEVRAYLARVSYTGYINPLDVNKCDVAICYKCSSNEVDKELLNETAAIFKSIFSANLHIDIMFLNHLQETELREVCCPFYTAPLFQVQKPDFYLTRSESGPRPPIECFKRKKLVGVNSTGYLLCDIKPPIIGQGYGLGAKDINQLIFIARFNTFTLFPITKWPAFITYCRPAVDGIENINYIKESDIYPMQWGELYKHKNDS